MSVTVSVTHDDIRPALQRAGQIGGTGAVRILRAMGTTLKSITEGTFNSVGADFRPTAWKPKYDGKPSNLQKSTTMAKSFFLEVTSTEARVSNPMPYAAIHQFGGVIRAKGKKSLSWIGPDGKRIFRKKVTIPARPFFPVVGGKLTPKAAERIARAGERIVQKIVSEK